MGIRSLLLLLLTSVMLAACTNREKAKDKNVNSANIYFDYQVWGEEGKADVTCVLQYRFGGPDGTTLVLGGQNTVQIDGQILHANSTKFLGTYYEDVKPLAEFKGMHEIVFTGADGKQYKEKFAFTPFSLLTELPEKIQRKPFTVKLKNFPAGETPLRLLMIDTAFATNDVNEIIRVRNGEVKIDSLLFRQLMNGPISLELYREEERPLKQQTKAGGKLSISYSLKREFELVD